MKIGIITIHNSPNYGACLQSYALYKYLNMQGCDVEIIDLHRPIHSDYVNSRKYVSYNPKPDLPWYRQKIRLLRGCFKKTKYTNELDVRSVKFNAFNAKIKLSRPFKGIDELYSNPPHYDIYITGSDQLWNPTQPFCIEPYFLTFVKDKKSKKISYASSIGHDVLTEKEKADYKTWLENYDYVSVREVEAQRLLSSFVDKEIYRVSDPTFLLDSFYWKSIVVPPKISESYILCFKLCTGNHLVEYASKLGKQSGKKVIVLPGGDEIEGCEIIRNAGPEEFLGYIQYADMLISDSFHANVFGILLGTKNQFAYIHPDNHRGSRLVTLFQTYGLVNHFIKPDLSNSYDELASIPKNKKQIEEIIETEKMYSRKYLLDAIFG